MTAPDEKFADYLSAEKARTQEKYTEAIRLFEKIIDKDPDEHGVRVVLGDLLLKAGDPDAALSSYYRAAVAYRAQGHLTRYQEVVARMTDADPEGRSVLLKKLRRARPKKAKDSQERRAAAEATALPDEPEVATDDPLGVDLFSETQRLTSPASRGAEDREELGDGVSITLTAPLFRDLSPQARARLVERMAVLNVRAGSVIYREGDPGSSLYVIGSGRAVLTFRGPGGDERVFGELGPGEFFGEFAFLTGSPRQFTVKVIQAGRIFQLARKSLEDLQKASPALTSTLFRFYRERVLDRVLAGSALFGTLTAEQRKEVADRFVLESYPCGSVIIAEGSRGDQLYLIRHGEVRVTATSSRKEEVFIASLCANDVFGEFSFLTGKPRAASVVAVSDAELLTVSRSALEPVLSRHPEVLRAMKKVYFERMADNLHKLAASS